MRGADPDSGKMHVPLFLDASNLFLQRHRVVFLISVGVLGALMLMQIRLRVSKVRQPKAQAPQICRLLIT